MEVVAFLRRFSLVRRSPAELKLRGKAGEFFHEMQSQFHFMSGRFC